MLQRKDVGLMIDGEIELKDKIFIVKKGTKIGKPFVRYCLNNCLFIINSSKKAEAEYEEWQYKDNNFTIETKDSPEALFTLGGGEGTVWEFGDGVIEFAGIIWTNFKERWDKIEEWRKKGNTVRNLSDEVTEEKESEAAIANRIIGKSW